MKVTKEYLKQVIKEEYNAMENNLPLEEEQGSSEGIKAFQHAVRTKLRELEPVRDHLRNNGDHRNAGEITEVLMILNSYLMHLGGFLDGSYPDSSLRKK